MTRNPVTAHLRTCSLHRGAPAVAFVLHAANHRGYTPALATLDAHITTLTRHRLELSHQRIDRSEFPATREFDLISGFTGIGAYLLHRHPDGDLLREVLTYLARLAQPLRANGEEFPGWWSCKGPGDRPSSHWPGGHGNLGLAHGIAGPLALMATAMKRGITVTGQAEAISRICSWLDRWRQGTGTEAWWPGTISRTEQRSGTIQQGGPGRPSWCYGTPGLARAQQLAAQALGDTSRQRQAEQALAGCATDEKQLTLLRDASLCHGWTGLLHIVWRVVADAGSDSRLAKLLPLLRDRMEQHLDRHGPPAHDGLLEGMAGIRLARHTTAGNASPPSRWDACLLLDG